MRISAIAKGLALVIVLAVVCHDARAQLPMAERDVASSQPSGAIQGWLNWRGPQQNGVSAETNLPDRWQPGGINDLWSIDLPGRGTAVVGSYPDGDRVFVWGYRGEGVDLVEVLLCLDAATGERIWEHQFSDYISDIIYNRYSIGAPTIDAETGNVYLMTSPGMLMGFDRDGKMLWQRSMMEEFGRLNFPNGRTGAPAIDGDLVIINTISANWGSEGPGRNRFYALNKHTGEKVWASRPGVGPPFLKDSSFSTPLFEWRNGMRVFYAGTGCGNIVCVNARTGDPLWRFQLAIGGVNSSLVVHEDKLIAIHGKENTDDAGRGRMVAIQLGVTPEYGKAGPVVLGAEHELWRNNGLSMFTSSPVIVDNRVYQVTATGDLHCVDVETGETLWHKKLGADQLHASPLYADGKLYIPMWHDGLYIIKPTEAGAEVLDQVKLQGACMGSPSVWNGRIYVLTTQKLYCFGSATGATRPAQEPEPPLWVGDTTISRIQAIPAEVLLRPGQTARFAMRGLDAAGQDLGRVGGGTWRKYNAPKARGKSFLDAQFNEHGYLVAGTDVKPSAGEFEVDIDGARGYVRGRILPSPPYTENFESFDLKLTDKAGAKYVHPPLAWIGGRPKWQIRQIDGNKLLVKTLNIWLFQRAMTFIGHVDDRNYTISADVKTDGNRRLTSDVGLINQRYLITLRGNGQQLEINSNIERLSVTVPFSWSPKKWYRLKTRVDLNADGSGVVRARAWARDEDEPKDWTIEVPVRRAHTNGSPGLFGFSPNIKFAVYIDNIVVTPND